MTLSYKVSHLHLHLVQQDQPAFSHSQSHFIGLCQWFSHCRFPNRNFADYRKDLATNPQRLQSTLKTQQVSMNKLPILVGTGPLSWPSSWTTAAGRGIWSVTTRHSWPVVGFSGLAPVQEGCWRSPSLKPSESWTWISSSSPPSIASSWTSRCSFDCVLLPTVFIQGLWKKQCLWTLHQTETLNTSAGSSTKSSSLPSSQFCILRWHRYSVVLTYNICNAVC